MDDVLLYVTNFIVSLNEISNLVFKKLPYLQKNSKVLSSILLIKFKGA